MKMNKPVLKRLSLVAGALVWCALNLHGQSAPTITTQPASQAVLPGSNVTFSVGVDGTGPFSYQWQFNGTNLRNTNITIATVAGGGSGGDGGAATNAGLSSPSGVALDAFGNLYIADYLHNRVRKVDTNGIIATVAGNGSQTYSGDGGAATNASLFRPQGLALDAAGNLYIADALNNRIRKVDTNGLITTVAGGASGGDGGAATNARLATPSGVAVDVSGNLYIVDYGSPRIRKVDTNGIIQTVAGNGSQIYSGDGGAATNAGLNGPEGAGLDAAGNLYIADTSHQRVRKVDTNGIIITVAGNGSTTFSGDGGAATNASLSSPYGAALDAFGNLYIVDYGHSRIRKVDTNGLIATVAGNGNLSFSGDGGAATNAGLMHPQGLALDASGNLYIADTSNQRIRAVHFAGYPTLALTNVSALHAGNYTVVIGNAQGSVTSVVATLSVPAPPIITHQPTNQTVLAGSNAAFAVAVGGSGPFGYLWYFDNTNLVQSDTNSTLTLPGVLANNAGNYTVVVTNTYGSVTSQVATLMVLSPPSVTSQPGSLTVFGGNSATFSVTVDGTGPFTYQWQVNGTNLPRNYFTIATVAGNGSTNYSGDGGAATNAGVCSPRGVALDAAGNLYIADALNNRVRKVDTNGIITTIAGNGDRGYSGDGGTATNASLSIPFDAAVDGSSNLYVSDSGNSRIRKVGANGIISTVAGGGTAYPGDGGEATNAGLTCRGLAVDAAGNLYIADQGNYRIHKVDRSGIITTVAGCGVRGSGGDGGAATAAYLNYPMGVELDPVGNLYIADQSNNRIRKVGTNGLITTVAGNGSTNYSGDGGAATAASLANITLLSKNRQKILKLSQAARTEAA